jgi:hypothetical protein
MYAVGKIAVAGSGPSEARGLWRGEVMRGRTGARQDIPEDEKKRGTPRLPRSTRSLVQCHTMRSKAARPPTRNMRSAIEMMLSKLVLGLRSTDANRRAGVPRISSTAVSDISESKADMMRGEGRVSS